MSSETPPDAAALAAAGTPAAVDGGASKAEGAMSAGGTSPPDKPPSSPGAGLGTQDTTASAGTNLGLLQDAAGLRSLLLQRCSQQQLARSLASQPPRLPHAESGAPMGKPPAMAGASESRPPATAETDKYILLLEENRRLQAQILTSERGESQHLTGPFRQGWGKPRPDTGLGYRNCRGGATANWSGTNPDTHPACPYRCVSLATTCERPGDGHPGSEARSAGHEDPGGNGQIQLPGQAGSKHRSQRQGRQEICGRS